jgi:3-hydroxyisobutyrate dehydrogenase-like beta-hydroxyacid dehydrogenase
MYIIVSASRTVTVIGTGVMGSAIARTLASAGHAVTVWNRTLARAETLRDAGAVVAGTLVEALESSEVIVMCVADHVAVDELMAVPGVAQVMSGRTLVQLTTGDAEDGRRGRQHADDGGFGFVVGAIIAYPRAVGTPQATILCAGQAAAFEACRELLSCLGDLQYAGEDPGLPGIIDGGLCSLLFATLVGFTHGAALAQQKGVHLDEFLRFARPYFRINLVEVLDETADRMQARNYGDTQSSVATSLNGLDNLVIALSQESGVDYEVMSAIKAVFQRAIDGGRGDEDVASLIEVFARG